MQPARYWRDNKTWKVWVGKRGTVVVSTVVTVSSPEHAAFQPYSYVLVNFGTQQHEFMGSGHETFQEGDKVECALRKITSGDDRSLIGYGIKVKKVT